MFYEEITDVEILQKIGSKLKELRLEQNVKQKELAEKSGLSMFSISQMETGHNTSMQSIIQFLRALNRLDILAPLFSPLQGETQSQTKQRVSRGSIPTTLNKDDDFSHHKVVRYQLPEDSGYSIAAEPDIETKY